LYQVLFHIWFVAENSGVERSPSRTFDLVPNGALIVRGKKARFVEGRQNQKQAEREFHELKAGTPQTADKWPIDPLSPWRVFVHY